MYNALESLQAFEAGQGQRKAREEEAGRMKLGNALAGGDYKGASGMAYGMGNYEAGMEIAKYGKGLEDAEAEKKRQGLIGLGMKYLQLPEQQRRQSRDQIVQELAQFGVQMDPQQALGMDLSDRGIKATLATLQDPESLMKNYQAMMAPTEYGFQNVSGVGLVRTDPRKGTAETAMAAVGQPSYKQVTTADGIYEYIEGQPESMTFLGKAPSTSSGGGGAGEYGLAPIYGRDADGNRVLIQANKAGGVRQADLPEGVTLEDDYSRTFSREIAKEDAKKAAYATTAGQALSAFETKTDELLVQIDDAVEKTNKGNTGLIGQFIAAGDLDGVLDSIGAKAMLSELVAIKAQGGALGALSDSEGKALRDAAVNVARSQSEEQLDRNLKAYRLQVENSRMRLKQAFEEQYVNNVGGARPAGGSGQGRPVGPSGQPVPEGFE